VKVAIIGATGAVGREMVIDLAESNLSDISLRLFATPRSAGSKVSFRDQAITVDVFRPEELRGFDYILMSAGSALSKETAAVFASWGITVIDNSSAWRMDPNVALIVPEVNGGRLGKTVGGRIIANPNCSTIQMVVALKPLEDAFGLDLVQAATYQSVSGTGQKGIAELGAQIHAHFSFSDAEPQIYSQPIAFNVLPAIADLDAAGHCGEEEKMVLETRKIMDRPDLEVLVTTVRVPTFHCHGEAVTVRLKKAVTRHEAMAVLARGEGLDLVAEDQHSTFPTPRMMAGSKGVTVSRVRTPLGVERSNWLQMWVIADNLKKGAATNAVQILERLSANR